jgi:N-acetyltransferase
MKIEFNLQPTLENDLLIIRPMQDDDFEAIYQVASDPLIWAQHPAKDRYKREIFTETFIKSIATGKPLMVIDKKTNAIIGSTRFNHVKEPVNAIEIGWSFLARAYWGGDYNKSQKHLLMDYAFQHVNNVLFYIHQDNTRSRKGVEKLGGKLIKSLDYWTLETRSETDVIYKMSKIKYLKAKNG